MVSKSGKSGSASVVSTLRSSGVALLCTLNEKHRLLYPSPIPVPYPSCPTPPAPFRVFSGCGRGHARDAHKLFSRHFRGGRDAIGQPQGGESRRGHCRPLARFKPRPSDVLRYAASVLNLSIPPAPAFRATLCLPVHKQGVLPLLACQLARPFHRYQPNIRARPSAREKPRRRA